jgi:undecaprenyl-diphosphatase
VVSDQREPTEGAVMSAPKELSRRPLASFIGTSVIGLVLVVALVIACAALIMLMETTWPPLERFDRGAAALVDRTVERQSPAATGFAVIMALGGNVVMWWLATVTAAGMVLRRQLRLAVFLMVTGLGALALAPLIKLVVAGLPWERPALAMPGNAFPSGHAINAVVFYGALLLVFLPAVPRHLRGVTAGLVAAMVVAIGLTQAALGVHYASDIVGGWICGLTWLAVTTYAFRRWRTVLGRDPRPLGDGLEPDAASVLAPGHVIHMRHPVRTAAVVLVSAMVVAATLVGLGLLVATVSPGFDDAVPRWLAAHRTAPLDRLAGLLSWAGNPKAILSIGLVIAPLAIGCVHRWRPAAYLAVLMAGEFVVVLTIAAIVRRPIPAVPQVGDDVPGSGFPAGPTAATVCLYGALAVILVPRTRPRGWLRRLTLVVVVAVPAGVALSGLYRGAYRPLDIAGAVLLALAWLAVVTFAFDPNVDLHTPPPVPVAGGSDVSASASSPAGTLLTGHSGTGG